MRWWRKKPKLDRETSLGAIPQRNPAAGFYKDDLGLLRISIPRRRTWWVNLLARVFHLPRERRFSLDEVGSFVWEQCDGKRSLRQVIRGLARQYQLRRKEAEVSTANYMKMLMKKGLIGMKMKGSGQG
jgi:hypothetical protein